MCRCRGRPGMRSIHEEGPRINRIRPLLNDYDYGAIRRCCRYKVVFQMSRAVAILQHREEVAPDHFLLYLDCPEVASAAVPGQFVHMRVAEGADPLLRRPFSIMLSDAGTGEVRLLVRVVGRGTEAIASHADGTHYDLLGPLGRGWTLPEGDEDLTLVAGGVGVAPLIALADHLRLSANASHLSSLYGAATEDLLVCWTEFSSRCDHFVAATDDGSAGEEGLITEVLATEISERGGGRLDLSGDGHCMSGLDGAVDGLRCGGMSGLRGAGGWCGRGLRARMC